MMRKSKLILLTLVSVLICTAALPVGAQEKDETLKLTMEEAVKLGLENSIDLKKVRNEVALSDLRQDRADHLSHKLDDADERISEGRGLLNSKEKELNQGKEAIEQKLQGAGLSQEQVDEIMSSGDVPDAIPSSDVLESKIDYIKQSKTTLEEKKDALQSGEASLLDSLQQVGTNLSGKLNFDSLDQLSVRSTRNLMTTMANVSYEVAKASEDIYRNKIAMLIQKNYYDVLKAKKMLEVKRKAMERGRKQYEFAKVSYEEGMKAKDDMLLAEVYYKGTEIEYEKAKGEYNNAVTELKKNLNVPFDTNIELTDVMVNKAEEPNLEEGLESGLKNRLEMKKSMGEVVVYDLNFDVTKRKYPDITYQNREAKLLKNKARINYDKTTLEVKSSIHQSYETLKSTGKMLETAQDMVERAKESLEIAEYKYKEGFGVETSLLKKLDLESSAGTIVEVLAAEENLSKVEEKVVEITYGYNLAKMKYYNDIGKVIY